MSSAAVREAGDEAGRISPRGKVAWGLIVLLGVLHFDFWWWNSDALVFGFVPLALAFHAGISISAAIAWALVVQWDWPEELEAWADAGEAAGEGATDADHAR